MREEEIKNRVAQDYFGNFDCTKIIGNIDFCVRPKKNTLDLELFDIGSFVWAEAKQKADYDASLAQLILTIGKARTFDTYLPPSYLGAFDSEKISFVPYNEIHDIFYTNDFNWNVAPSNYNTREFQFLKEKINKEETNPYKFFYEEDNLQLRKFIKDNLIHGKSNATKIRIDKNNFVSIYNKWTKHVKPTIDINWEAAKKMDTIDGDFYLADVLSEANQTIRKNLHVVLKKNEYELDKTINEMNLFNSSKATFLDGQKSHKEFWNKYERPPRQEYQDYIIGRRDLLVPQDIRERKGSFFTPQIWVELSQKYLTDALGKDWQDEYYIWDCAAGTGNLLAGLTNKYNVWASTLDKQDVDVMKERSENGANLLKSHIFQFDFLNDDFTKLPQGLQDIINDPEKRKKLVIYINPPYAEAGSVSVTKERKNKTDVSTKNSIWERYKNKLGLAVRELFIQFFIRVHQEIPDCHLAVFSKLKYLNGKGFDDFRKLFRAEYKNGFVVPANTFDNVKGIFPISFALWNLENRVIFDNIRTDVYNGNGDLLGKKKFYVDEKSKRITDWINQYNIKAKVNVIGYTGNNGPDFQNSNYCYIGSESKTNKNGSPNNATKYSITKDNIVTVCIYFAVRHVFAATWLNDRDQFLYPNDGWKLDKEFQNDCLTFALFDGQNRITSEVGINHWIPFTEKEIQAQDKFASNFMTDFIAGKFSIKEKVDLFNSDKEKESLSLEFSNEAKAVFDAGRKLWKYYHNLLNVNVNASLYDIRLHFQGRNSKGRMNSRSEDKKYTELIGNLRDEVKTLAQKIQPKVYEYGFLKE